MTTPSVLCISIVSPDDSLFFIKKYNTNNGASPSDDIEMDSYVFLGIDGFGQGKTFRQSFKNDRFFILFTKDWCNVYGYKAPLGYKIIVIISASTNPPNQSSIQNLCERVKDELFSSFMNPFYSPFAPTTSPILKAKIDQLVSAAFVD
ncbi:hypothetical protein TRFO_40466 [Tritrichomonas foetus]|uniref:Trafficking protein particle complex subunit 2-like protein n=1 Tax=Tritrichomonas foetus TaxID=1144522 RepID=A0A1J4J130_9EUKA|nr:hypothetical protein TRFO_40466 [Tritrichomonas foetus]|eukprot:OHS93240.1 hypothetical protein TRFO_40466 [Tritrichomonas foetus]